MFINFWYVAARVDEVSEEPLAVTMLGQKLVLFRDEDDTVHCLSDICIHRGAALSTGKNKGYVLECPYHGWQFNGEGHCVRIPSEGPDVKISARYRVDSYPVVQRYGLLHVFLGDLPEQERPPIMDLQEWSSDQWRWSDPVVYDWNINYMRSTENALDPAHTEFVHEPLFGAGGDDVDFKVPALKVIENDWGVGCMYEIAVEVDSSVSELDAGRYVEAGTIAYGPCHYVTKINMTATMSARQYSFVTPIDEYKERHFFLSARNFSLEPVADEMFDEINLQVIEQDRCVLETLDPPLTPDSMTEESMVRADGVVIAYREKLKDWQLRGWRIDSEKLAQYKQKGNKAFAIPSPARRQKTGWVVSPVPLLGYES